MLLLCSRAAVFQLTFLADWQIVDFSTNISNFNWQSTYSPYEETRAVNMGGNFITGFNNSKNSEEGEKFIKWLYEEENYKQLCTYAGYLPAVEDLTVDYEQGQDAYEIYNQEIATICSTNQRQSKLPIK